MTSTLPGMMGRPTVFMPEAFDAQRGGHPLGKWHVHDPAYQFASPYVGMGNNPVMGVDPDGEFIFTAMAIGAAIFGAANLATQASSDEIDTFWDGAKAFVSGAIAGAATIGAIPTGLSVPVLGTALKVAGAAKAIGFSTSAVTGLWNGVFNNDWSRLENTMKLHLGNFYLDGNRNTFGQTLQGLTRFTWEFPQTTFGYTYSQFRNAFGGVDRVDYFGGATFVTNENSENRGGMSPGSFINMSIRGEIGPEFQERVLNDPLFMHEFGHSFDSQTFGALYLPIIGLPSLFSAATSRSLPGSTLLTSHRIRWYERNANKHAARYFSNHYDIDWSIYEPPLGRYPRKGINK